MIETVIDKINMSSARLRAALRGLPGTVPVRGALAIHLSKLLALRSNHT